MNDKPERMPNVPPFVRFVASAVPMVFDNSLSYYEALCALWKYVQGMTDVINNNATLEEEFIKKVNELETFVNTYFDNLDVQEEINAKLDAMAEAGTLADIISQYLDSTAIFGFDTVADMKQATNLVNGSYARTLGYHSINDYGAAVYKIRDLAVGDVVDEASLIAIGDDLVAELNHNGLELNVKTFGAYGDNTHDDAAAFQACIDYAYKSKIKVINIPEGVYLISQPLEVYENKNYNLDFTYSDVRNGNGYPVSQITFKGSEMYNTMLKANSGNYIFNAYATTPVGIQDVTFENIYFNGNDIAKSAFQMDIEHFGGRWITFKNCSFNSFTEAGIQHLVTSAKVSASPLGNDIKLVIDSCYIANNENGLQVGGDDTIIKNCTVQNNTSWGIVIDGSIHNYNIEDCKIQYNGTDKTLFNGGQILASCSGSSLTIDKSYFEPKSGGDATKNDTGFMVFAANSHESSSVLNAVTITNCYFNGTKSPTVFNRIGNTRIAGFYLRSNRFVGLLGTGTDYLITTSADVLTSGGFTDDIQDISNNIVFTSSANVDYASYMLINESGSAPAGTNSCAGGINTSRGLWSPNCTGTRFFHEIPTIIAGAVSDNGNPAMRNIGDFTVTKSGTGVYDITFTKSISCYGYNGTHYPVLASLESANENGHVKISNRTASGFRVTTGTWDSGHTTFTPSDLRFGFVALFLTNW